MVKDHSDSKKGNLLQLYGLLFPISNKGSFLNAPSHIQDITFHTHCYISCGALAGMRNNLVGIVMKDRFVNPSLNERTLYHRAKSRSSIRYIPCDNLNELDISQVRFLNILFWYKYYCLP